MKYLIREMRFDEFSLLTDILYEAIFVPEGVKPPPRSILSLPSLRLYVDGFGQSKHDVALVAEVNGKIAGAIWARIMDDYGHIDNHTPSLAIALFQEYRGKGIGSMLLNTMLKVLHHKGYQYVSLAVQKKNAAVRMYHRTGFVIVDENEEEYIMRYTLA